MLPTPCILVYSVYWPTNALNEMQLYTNHKTQFMISITPTSFGTEVPSTGSLRTQRTRWSMKTKDHKSNTPLQVLITVTVIFKIWKSRIHNFTYSGVVTWQSGAETCRVILMRNCVPWFAFYCTSLLVTIQAATMQNESAFSAKPFTY
jgi:hypothetical protein